MNFGKKLSFFLLSSSGEKDRVKKTNKQVFRRNYLFGKWNLYYITFDDDIY